MKTALNFSKPSILIKARKYVTAINRFMYEHDIDRKLQTQISVYLAHLWESQKKRDYDSEQLMIKKLAPALRE
jgi:potassium voltage-gated channel Eag-related subfamily H protein 1/potassium voltage-gated channel Eag-related subfamily H protein 5